jgi:DNA mismatch repair protein MutL
MRIKLLPPILANQIAAGEVVERPVSVVKELIENSLDAGATLIEIQLKEGGKRFIQVRDNGDGIEKDDLSLAVSRHATSKISNTNDLAAIRSLGFRGEALASISSVSQLSISSKTKEAEMAWKIAVHGTDLQLDLSPCSHPQGTSITVKDLFFNTPARKKFLRTAQTELAHIDELVKRFALSHFDVAIHLSNDESNLRQFPAANSLLQQEKRVIKILGQRFIQQAKYVDMSSTSLRLTGWVGLPTFSRQQSDLHYFYVNGRMVRDRLLNHAVRQAYEDLLPIGRYAAYVLYLEIDPAEVDVNVHPTKHEVRFQQGRLVHDFIVSSLKKVLTGQITPIDETTHQLEITNTFKDITEKPRHQNNINYVAQSREKYNQFINNALAAKSKSALIGITHDKYAIYETAEGIILVEVSAISAQHLAKKWAQEWHTNNQLEKKLLLIPQQITLSAKQIAQLIDKSEELRKLGLEYNALGNELLLLRTLPKGLKQIQFSEELLELLIDNHLKDEAFFLKFAKTNNTDHQQEWLEQMEERQLQLLSPIKVRLKLRD